MIRFLVLTLFFFGVIDHGYSVKMHLRYHPQIYFDDDYNNVRRQDFHELFIDLADLFIEADVARRRFGLKVYDAQDIYTADEYKRVYPFEDYLESSIEIMIRNRVMKVSARSKYRRKEDLQDIVILVDNLLTHQVHYYVDLETSALIISIPFKKSGTKGSYNNELECCDMRPYLR